jgi:hypothetical protein
VAPKVEAPRPEAPKPDADLPDNPIKIARFVHQIPREHLPDWAAHPSSRITDESYEAFKNGAGK